IAASDNWSDWKGLGGGLRSAPSVAMNADGRLTVIARGVDNAVWEISETTAGGWGEWTKLGGHAGYAPVLARNAEGGLEIFVIGEGKGLLHNSQSGPNGNWKTWRSLGARFVGTP